MRSVTKALVFIGGLILAVPFTAQIFAETAITLAQAQTRRAVVDQPKPPKPRAQVHSSRKRIVNSGTVSIIADTIGSTHTRMTADLAAVFDRGNELRILPVLGRGAEQSITDILYLKGIDFGIVQSDVLKYIREQGKFSDIKNRIHYITKLHNQEFHVIARKDIKTLKDLSGQKVNVGIKGSGAHITASAVFKAHGVDVKVTDFDEVNALDKLKLGELAAMVYVAGKPAPIFAHVQASADLHLIPVPYVPELKDYLPARFAHNDYPGLVQRDATVPTIAVRAVLAVFNWRRGTQRYGKVVKFISTLFTSFHELRKPPRHPKWREVNIHAKVPGWNRFPPATEWVAKNLQQVAERRGRFRQKPSGEKQAFARFIQKQRGQEGAAPVRPADMDLMFQQFLKWRGTQAGRSDRRQ